MTAQTASATGSHRVTMTLVSAAAVLGLAELALHRVIAPVFVHVPTSRFGDAIGGAADLGGSSALSATAVLVAAAAVAFVVAAWRRDRPTAIAVGVAGLAVAMLIAWPARAPEVIARMALLGVAAALAGAALARLPRWHAVAVGTAALAVVAGQWPFLVEVVSPHSAAGAAPAKLAELALVLVPVMLALAVVERRSPGRAAWGAAFAASLLAAALIAREPTYSAILSTWAAGATLSLPPALYIFAAGCAALVLASCVSDVSARPLAAGLVLLAVAGVQPALVHHNLTALLALAVLAGPVAEGAAAQRAGVASTAAGITGRRIRVVAEVGGPS